MIVQIRGTSGSGKTHLVKEFMRELGGFIPFLKKGRKRPLYYRRGSLIVLGSYETPCGGCDTIGSWKKVYDLISCLKYKDLLFEGLILGEDTNWTKSVKNVLNKDITIVYLNTELEDCIKGILKRRADRGDNRPINDSNTRKRVKVILGTKPKLEKEGITCLIVSREKAKTVLLEKLIR